MIMTNLELDTLANSIFKDRGGIFHVDINQNNSPSRYMKEANFILNYLKIKYSNLPQIHICFLDNSEINACALKHNNVYFIAINIGTCVLLDNIFFSYFASSSILNHIGDVSNEHSSVGKINAIYRDDILEFDRNCGIPFNYPKNKTRFDYAILYSNFAFDYLILHECCHIIRGHIDLMQSILITSDFNWSEAQCVTKEISDENIPLISQTLEMDADSFATNHAIYYGIENVKNKQQPTEAHSEIFSSLNSFLENWGFAIYSLFRIFQFHDIEFTNLKHYMHPPPAGRLNIIQSNIATLLLEYYKIENAHTLLTNFVNSVFLSEKTFMEATDGKTKIDKFIEASQDETIANYLKEISINWNYVRPLLKPFSFGELPGEFKLN